MLSSQVSGGFWGDAYQNPAATLGVATGCNTKRVCPIFGVPSNHLVDRIAQLKPVTQLYISVDAATPGMYLHMSNLSNISVNTIIESLKIVDRPLFPDYWERFLACIDELSKKGQRTVFRLTLIKGWNTEEVQSALQPIVMTFLATNYCAGGSSQSLKWQLG